MENLNIFIRSIFVDNMIFAYFLGMCSFIAVSKNVKTAFGLGIAVTFMLVVTLPVNYLLQTYVLSAGALSWLGPEYADIDLSFLSLIMFIAVIASMTQLVEMTVEKYSPALYRRQLRHHGRFALHAAERFPECLDCYMRRWRLGTRMAPCHHGYCCHS